MENLYILLARFWWWFRHQDLVAWSMAIAIIAVSTLALVANLTVGSGGGQNGPGSPAHPSPGISGTLRPSKPSDSRSGSPAPSRSAPARVPGHMGHRHGHPPDAFWHGGVVVRPGDNLWSISHSTRQHPFRWVHLAEVNHIRTPYIIHAGEHLRA